MKNFLHKIFERYCLIGIILVLSGVSCQFIFINSINNEVWNVFINILSNSVITIGTGLIIGYAIDMTKNNEENIEYLESRIKNIIISPDYLKVLNDEQKKKIINNCLINEPNNIKYNEYINNKVVQLDKLRYSGLRSNIDYRTTVSRNNNKIKMRTITSYTVYKVNNEFKDIIHTFDKNSSKIEEMTIILPDGENHKIKNKYLKLQKNSINQTETSYCNIVKVPNEYSKYDHITVKTVIIEEGYDHWAFLCWMSLYATNIISYTIICEDDLIIKEHMIFDNPNGLYHVLSDNDDSGNVKSYTITCDTWTDPYTGFALVIAEP